MSKKMLVKIIPFVMSALLLTACGTKFEPTPTNVPDGGSPSPTETTGVESPTPTATPEATPEVTPTPEPTPEPKEPIKVKAVYLTGTVAGSSARLDHFIELVNTTELNALVIDIKEGGYVNYDSQVPLVKELGLSKKLYNVEEVLRKCHENDIYVIGRIVVFRDDGLATKKPEFAIKKPNGNIWKEGSHGAWSNPYIEGVQQYNIDIAKEAVALGFDEIQFDYVRFPTAKASDVSYGENVPEKTEAISNFLKKAAEEIKAVKDVPVSADIFGIVAESDRDGKTIGQHFDLLGLNIDYISPMIYPSHYANDSNGTMGNGVGQKINGVLFTKPDLDPYGVIYQSLLKIKDRIATVPEFKAKVRPYLQDFTASYLPKGYWQTYGKEQIRAQIKAVYDAGYEEWILWSGKNQYTEDALLPQE
jgi:hypothetical protein